MDHNSSAEINLVQASINGSSDAYERLISSYQSLVCAITYSATGDINKSEELAQETFVRAWKNLTQLNDHTRFKSWLCSIAKSTIKNYYRKRNKDIIHKASEITGAEEICSDTPDPSDNLISKEQQVIVDQALKSLPESYSQPLILFYRQQQSVAKVADMLDLTEDNVRTRLSRGRKMLKQQVTDMIESCLSSTAPGKAFTVAVMASIAALAVNGTAAAAATASSTSTAATAGAASLTAITSGILAKIMIAAAVVAVGVSAAIAYRNITKDDNIVVPPNVSAKQTAGLSLSNQSGKDLQASVANGNENKIAAKQPAPKPSEQPNAESAKLQDTTPQTETSPPAAAMKKPEKTQLLTGLTGKVIDKTTSKPVKNAEICLSTPQGKKTVKTASNGTFEFAMDISADKRFPEKFEFRFNVIAKTYTSRRVSVHLTKNNITDSGNIELTPGTQVAGTVYDQDHKPIKGAKVATFHFTNHPATTDAEGKFLIDGLDPAQDSYSLHSKHPDYPSVTVRFSPIKAGETLYKDIVMKKGITVHGQITDSQGNPLMGISVGNTTSRCMWNVIEDRTDAQGKYKLKNVPPGEFVLWAINKKYAPHVEELTLEKDIKEKLLNIQLGDPNPLYGLVIDGAGTPVPNVSVGLREYKGVSNLSNHRVKTDSQGLFTIPNAPAEGSLILELYARHISSTMPELQMGKDLYTITVDRAGKIYGNVIAKGTKKPVNNFTVKIGFSKVVKAKSGYAATWSRQGHTFHSDQGHFDTGTENIPVGSGYAITVYAEGFEPLRIDPVTVQTASKTPQRTEFALDKATMIKGTVTDSNDLPVHGARVRWITDSNDDRHWDDRDTAITDKKGKFSIASIGNAAKALYLSAKEYSPVLVTVDNMPFNDNGQLEFKLQTASRIYGTVTGNDGKPISGAQVRVRSDYYNSQHEMRFPSPQTTTDIDGFYEILDLPPGQTTVSVDWPGESYSNLNTKSVDLRPARNIELNISPPVRYSVSGTIPGHLKGSDKVQITPYRYDPGRIPDRDWSYAQSTPAKINSDGTFTCEGLVEGKYVLFLKADTTDYAVTDEFELTADKPAKGLTFNVSTAVLQVNLVDSGTSTNVPDAFFYLMSEKGFYVSPPKVTDEQTQPDGSAIFVIPPGKYKAVVSSKNYFQTKSDFIELKHDQTKQITVKMTPCAMAAFKIPQDIFDSIGRSYAYIDCTVTDTKTGNKIPVEFNPKELNHRINIFRKDGRVNELTLRVPPGTYTIDYSLNALKSGKMSTILKASESAALSKENVTIINITGNSDKE